MSGLKTPAAAALALSTLASPATATIDLPRVFANCTGQLSAMVEYSWLMSDPAADRHLGDLERFKAMLDALGVLDDPETLNLRIEAKVAFHGLLSQAAFGTDADRAETASRRAGEQISSCRLLLLDG